MSIFSFNCYMLKYKRGFLKVTAIGYVTCWTLACGCDASIKSQCKFFCICFILFYNTSILYSCYATKATIWAQTVGFENIKPRPQAIWALIDGLKRLGLPWLSLQLEAKPFTSLTSEMGKCKCKFLFIMGKCRAALEVEITEEILGDRDQYVKRIKRTVNFGEFLNMIIPYLLIGWK